MSACLSCRTLVQLLKNEIRELSEKEQQLLRVNNALTEVVNRTNVPSPLQESSWKQKYEEQLKVNHQLKKKLMEYENHQVSLVSAFEQPATPRKSQCSNFDSSVRHRNSNNENHRSNSISRMQDFMKSVGPKVCEFSSSTRRTTATHRKNKGQIVLRIVNDRLNRKY